MIKKCFAFLVAVLLCFSMAVSASAYGGQYIDVNLVVAENGNGGSGDFYIEENFDDEYYPEYAEDTYDDYEEPETEKEVKSASSQKAAVSPVMIPVCLAIGLLIAYLIVKGIASKNISVKMQKNATVYTRDGSMALTGSEDNFLYKKVDRTAKPKQTANKKN